MPLNAEPRSAPSSASYASLRAGDESPASGAAAKSLDDAALVTETERLEHLKQALWAAFLAAPANGIPMSLVELASTYASTLRLQMTLLGLRSIPKRAVKVSGAPVSRDRQP